MNAWSAKIIKIMDQFSDIFIMLLAISRSILRDCISKTYLGSMKRKGSTWN